MLMCGVQTGGKDAIDRLVKSLTNFIAEIPDELRVVLVRVCVAQIVVLSSKKVFQKEAKVTQFHRTTLRTIQLPILRDRLGWSEIFCCISFL